ncbi:hypothetical protein SB775_29430, partial [Peribacillus sp. SIMBA_075]|uniref:hypothetical protein n=1 Tax=Peribacillus sp. SIMBA_075 TaxID=3085813 RepID=UPI0039785729
GFAFPLSLYNSLTKYLNKNSCMPMFSQNIIKLTTVNKQQEVEKKSCSEKKKPQILGRCSA